MSYLYGDSTPAPIDTNYLELLRNVLRYSVDILLATDRMQTWKSGIADRERAAANHIDSLRSLGQSIERVLDIPAPGGEESPTGRCAATIAMSARDTVMAEVRLVESTLATERERLAEKIAGERAECATALEQLLLVQDIPGATHQLQLRMKDDSRYGASARARLPIDASVTMAIDIPSDHMFAEPVRVDQLVRSLDLCAPEMRGWLNKKLKLVTHRLDKRYVTEFLHGDSETRIALRASASHDDSGFDLSITAETKEAVIVPVAKGGDDEELPPYQLDEEQTNKAVELRDALAAVTGDLRAHRTTIATATIDDRPLSGHDDPSVIVRRLVALITPVIDEIAQHSPLPDELVLKVPVGSDRREELFVPKADLWRTLEPLPPELRRLFDPLNLSPGELSALDEDWSDDTQIDGRPATD